VPTSEGVNDVHMPPVGSEKYGPQVSLVSSGYVISIVMSSYTSPEPPIDAVGGGLLRKPLTYTICPTPTGVGAALTKANVFSSNGGSCALVTGTATIEAVIASIRNKEIAIANLFLDIFFSLIFYFPFSRLFLRCEGLIFNIFQKEGKIC
jgi:hypothetical protein